jgi:hypothetical protein
MGSAARLAGMDGRCNTTDGRVVAYNTWWACGHGAHVELDTMQWMPRRSAAHHPPLQLGIQEKRDDGLSDEPSLGSGEKCAAPHLAHLFVI